MGCQSSKAHVSPPRGQSPRAPPGEEGDGGKGAQDLPLPHYTLEEIFENEGPSTGQPPPSEGRQRNRVRALQPRIVTFRVLLTGLSEAGKTHLLYTLLNPAQAVEPAETEDVGEETLYITRGVGSMPRVNFHILDLGGREDIRKEHLEEALDACAGVIMAVDATAPDKFDAASAWLGTVLESKKSFYRGRPVPVLLLGTKNDLPAAAESEAISSAVLGPLSGNPKRLFHTTTCSITSEEGHQQAAVGLHWLAGAIRTSQTSQKK